MKKNLLKVVLILIGVIILAALLYVGYVMLSYNRIPDNQELTPRSPQETDLAVRVGEEYAIVTQNIGFGAYTDDFTFFMDGGTESWAESPESVTACVNAAAETVSVLEPDFILFQEVDTDSTRSYHIDEQEILRAAYPQMAEVNAVNYHSAFLMYPLTQPHGSSNSSMVTFSKVGITAALRRSLPISTGFSKFLDLDRCYTICRVPTENGKELVLFNVHLSAYGGSDEIRAAQVNMLFGDMLKEYENGNYVVCGGDFNHDFTGNSTQVLNGGEMTDFGWAQPFPIEMLPAGLTRCDSYTDGKVEPTCRNCDIPYEEGNFTIIVDGFIVSDNVTVTYLENVQTGFTYSGHNPVLMHFSLDQA